MMVRSQVGVRDASGMGEMCTAGARHHRHRSVNGMPNRYVDSHPCFAVYINPNNAYFKSNL